MKQTKTCTLLRLAFSAITLASAQLINAETLVLTPTGASHIRDGQENQDTNPLLLVGDTANASDYLRACLAFDLSAPELLGATINSVTLTLTIGDKKDDSSPDQANTLDLHQLGAPFTNDSVTWTSRDGSNDWTNPGGDFGPSLVSLPANAGTVDQDTSFDFTNTALTTVGTQAVGSSLYLLVKQATEDANRSVFRFGSQSRPDGPILTIEYQTFSSELELLNFTHSRVDGSSQVSITGKPGGRYQLMEAADLDFSTPDQNPIPLSNPTTGTLDGNVVILDAGGNATVEFNLGTSKAATFIRAEEAP